jgi:AcrR family transcriptional regulator
MASKKTAPAPKRKSKTAPSPLGREDWLHAAKAALLKGGIDHVKVDRLAREIKMTRGSFYWHFTDRDDLLRALLDHWEATNTGPLLLAIEAAEKRGRDGFNEVTKVWIEEKEFSPAFDSAVRDWARKDAAVARAVRRIDEKRIEALTRLMNSFGFAPEEAMVRARVIYFHQVGYYALAIRESEAERHKLLPLYSKILVELDS